MIGAQVGVKKESSWDTGVTPTLFIPFLEESLEADRRRVEAAGQRAGQYVVGTDQALPYLFGSMGTHKQEVTTKNFAFWLEMLMGAVASGGDQGDGDYLYTGTFGPTLPSLTYQSNREFYPSGTDQAFTFSGQKVAKWTLECGMDGIVTLTAEFVGGTVTTATALASASYTAGHELLSHVGGALSIASTAVPVEEWKIEVDNNLDAERGKQKAAPLRQEPVRQGRPSVTWSAKVDFDSMTQYNRFAGTTAATIHAALEVVCTGPTAISGSAFPSLTATIPQARFDAAKGVSATGAEKIQVELSGVAADNYSDEPLTLAYVTAETTIPGI